MVTTVKAPSYALARFVVGDIRGGKDAHAYRMEQIGGAIRQALQGNWQPVAEAQRLSTGDSVKARAYRMAFDAAGVVQDANDPMHEGNVSILRKVAYVGKLDSPDNVAARATIKEQGAARAESFSAAFLKFLADDQAAKKAAKADAKGEDGADESKKDATAPGPVVTVAAPTSLGLHESVETILTAIKAGAIDADEVRALYEAIRAHYEVREVAALQTA